MESIAIALFLALVVNRVIEHFFKPIRSFFILYITDKLAWLDFLTPYVSWLLGGLLAWYSDVNLVPDLFNTLIVGKIVTAVIIGGGAGLIHDIFDITPPKSREFWAKLYKSKDDDCCCATD